MRVMTAHLDEALIPNANDLCGLVPNEKLIAPNHTNSSRSETSSLLEWPH